jgi:hypothetical protein
MNWLTKRRINQLLIFLAREEARLAEWHKAREMNPDIAAQIAELRTKLKQLGHKFEDEN